MPSTRDPAETEVRPPMAADDELRLLARRLPKAEMHMHHMGSLSPAQMASLSARAGRPQTEDERNSAFDNRGVGKFFDDLDKAVRLWGDSAAVTLGVLHMIAAAYDRGVRHLELLCTPDLHRQQIGMPPEVLLPAVGEAFTTAAGELGLTGGIVVEMHRFDGSAAALSLVEETVPLRDAGVPILGYGNDGDHRSVPFEALAPAYARARGEGFLLTGHVDVIEDVGPALDLELDRIDHGWMAVDDTTLVDRLAKAGIPLTFTPDSYALGGLQAGIPYEQAWQMLHAAGIRMAIGTDDPELHHTDLAQCYHSLATKLGWTRDDLAQAAKASFDIAWLPASSGQSIRDDWAAEIDALAADSRSPRRKIPTHS